MSGPSSYRLQAPRPRRAPSPLDFNNSGRPLSVLSTKDQEIDLLYDLPTHTSISPPTSPRSPPRRMVSPTSPTFSTRTRATRNGRPTPPPSGRNRSQTPLGVAPSELEQFAENCRAWYYCQDDNAGRKMTQTLATLPPSQRAPFSRLQASIRSSYHRSVNARRHAEFQAHLSSTTPGGSLLAHARSDPRGQSAQKERYERMDRFIRTWCNAGMPGTKPFFEALWAILRLQVIPENLGGAGTNQIEWEFDDAVFKESAGKDFMLEAIDILKGVLAFEERPSKIIDTASRKDLNFPPVHTRGRSVPLPSVSKAEVAQTVQPKRPRAPSDPFLDAPSTPFGGSSSHSPNAESILASVPDPDESPPSPILPAFDVSGFLTGDEDEEEEYLRIWLSPDLANPEILQLLKLFPDFVSRRPLPRFPVSNPRTLDIEEGDDDGIEGRTIRFGTGSMWVSSKQRSDGWEGGLWQRIVMWWRRLFC
ncbi:hypothetical protein CPB83DRAFT_812470 [Crepidotus variabilis]|uniref:Uncharacterized protein n=1 Tax=Crepidotus variabilis TaxID=179855 RepID=A0A9P6JR52_9AGAR|nr:hypothetical protein CPB83DRAFT_812470 [Crepidotus variabilis]